MKIIYLSLLISLIAISQPLANQNEKVDSLKHVLQQKTDSARISILLEITWEIRNSEPENAARYGQEAIELAKQFNDFENLAKAYSFAGVAYRVMGNYSKALDMYYLGLDVAKEHKVIEQQGFAYLNLANLHIYQEHYSLAKQNIKKAETIAYQTNNKVMLGYVYIYLGRAYQLEGNLDSALINFQKSLSIRQELENVLGEATCYKYMGDIFFAKKEFETSLLNYKKSLELVDDVADRNLYANILIMKAKIYLDQDNIIEAEKLANQSLDIAKEIGANLAIRDALEVLAIISIKNKKFITASNFFQRVIKHNDTLFSQQLSEKVFSLQYQLEKQQRDLEFELLTRDNAIKELEISRIRAITIALAIILALLGLIFVAMIIMLKQRKQRALILQRQNQKIINQRNSIQEKNIRLNETNEKLAKSEENLKKLIQTKDKLFSIIAHDLRNPFQALWGFSDLLMRSSSELDTDQIKQYASIIHDSSHKLATLVGNLLSWSRSQTGKMKLFPKSFNTNNLLNETILIHKPQLDAKAINVINEIPESVYVFADFDSIALVFRNLISNAIKYSNKNGTITLSSKHQNDSIVISISDSGVGIPQELIDKLFKIEESFTTAGTNDEEGTGIGLIICKEFVEKNNGTIGVDSKLGKGTTFYVSLPANAS